MYLPATFSTAPHTEITEGVRLYLMMSTGRMYASLGYALCMLTPSQLSFFQRLSKAKLYTQLNGFIPLPLPPISRTRIRLRFLPTSLGLCDAVAAAANVRGYSAPQLWFGLTIELRMTMYMRWRIYLETMPGEIEACARDAAGLIMSLDRQMVLLIVSRAAGLAAPETGQELEGPSPTTLTKGSPHEIHKGPPFLHAPHYPSRPQVLTRIRDRYHVCRRHLNC